MAGEFKHVSVGTQLTQAEYESITGHALDSQATGDMIYASSATQLSRLPIGSANQVLVVSGGIPAWSSALNITTLTVGTINGFTLAGTIAGGGQQLNNIIIGASSPLAGTFTSITGTGLTLTGGITISKNGGFANISQSIYSSTQPFHGPRYTTIRGRGTEGSPASVAAGDELQSLQVSAVNPNLGTIYAGGIFFIADNTVSGNNVPSYISFQTNLTNSARETATLDKNGTFMALGAIIAGVTPTTGVSGNGVFVQSSSTNNAISTASQGAGSTELFIGNKTILASAAINSVSPTSPNRTVTVVIGGSTVYLHGKTTND